jgi:ATP-dependent Clp protease protease subunit
MSGIKPYTEAMILNGIDESRRRIFFGKNLGADPDNVTDFDQASVEIAVRAIHKMAADAPKKPIEIHMNSYGGDPIAMMYLMDVILSCPCQIKFYGGGAIASSATWIMSVCDERYLYPNATVLVHAGSAEITGTHTDLQIDIEQERLRQERLEAIFANNSRMPKSFWHAVSKRDLWLSAEEAVALGLADQIIQPKKRGNLRKLRQANLSQKVNAVRLKKLVVRLFQRIQLPLDAENITLNAPHHEEADPNIIVDLTEAQNTNTIETKAEVEPNKESQ